MQHRVVPFREWLFRKSATRCAAAAHLTGVRLALVNHVEGGILCARFVRSGLRNAETSTNPIPGQRHSSSPCSWCQLDSPSSALPFSRFRKALSSILPVSDPNRLSIQDWAKFAAKSNEGMATIPNEIWLEHAVATNHPRPGESIFVAEGSLEQVVDAICELPPDDQEKILISLPNRVTDPIRFEAEMIPTLIREWLGS